MKEKRVPWPAGNMWNASSSSSASQPYKRCDPHANMTVLIATFFGPKVPRASTIPSLSRDPRGQHGSKKQGYDFQRSAALKRSGGGRLVERSRLRDCRKEQVRFRGHGASDLENLRSVRKIPGIQYRMRGRASSEG